MITPAYVFAHKALPSVFFKDPMGIIGLLSQPDGNDRLANLWQAAEGTGPSPTCQRLDIGGGIVILVTVPEARPENANEAPFVGLVVRESARLFTLEFSMDLGDGPATMFCEWDQEGTHLNHGQGPEVDVELFLEKIINQAF